MPGSSLFWIGLGNPAPGGSGSAAILPCDPRPSQRFPMAHIRLLLLLACIACVAQAAPYMAPGTKADPFLAYQAPLLALTGAW